MISSFDAAATIYGGSAGGPIVIPGLFDGHGKYFFFFNQENNYNPSETPRARTIIRESALNGLFTYNTASPRTVDIWALATKLGQINTYDPTIKALLQTIRKTHPKLPVVVTTAYVSMEPLINVLDLEHSAYLVKPYDLNDLAARIDAAG